MNQQTELNAGDLVYWRVLNDRVLPEIGVILGKGVCEILYLDKSYSVLWASGRVTQHTQTFLHKL